MKLGLTNADDSGRIDRGHDAQNKHMEVYYGRSIDSRCDCGKLDSSPATVPVSTATLLSPAGAKCPNARKKLSHSISNPYGHSLVEPGWTGNIPLWTADPNANVPEWGLTKRGEGTIM